MNGATPNLDELRRLNNQLKLLLDEPQPGLASWAAALRSTLKKIAEFVA